MTTAPDAARIGVELDGKYLLVRLLGTGGMSAVYEARHRQLERRVAIKFLLPEIATESQLIARFRNEARAAGALHHENIAAVYDVGTTIDGAQYLVMELLDGVDCAALLKTSVALPRWRAVDLVIQVCRGLSAAHDQGIVHRDLKPANLFLTRRADGTDLIKVLDFGIAKLRRTPEADLSTGTGTAVGTPHYMSPEQARGDRDIDPRTDIYSLGVILFEFLSGRRPHEGDSVLQILHRILTQDAPRLSRLRHDLPAGLCDVVERALSKSRDERFGSMREFQDALQPFAAGVNARGEPRPTAADVTAPNASAQHAALVAKATSERTPRPLALWLVLACAFLGALALLGLPSDRQAPPSREPRPRPTASERIDATSKSETPTAPKGSPAAPPAVSERPLDRPDPPAAPHVPTVPPPPPPGFDAAAEARPKAPSRAPAPRAASPKRKQNEAVAPPSARALAAESPASKHAPAPPSAAPQDGRRLNIDRTNPYP